MKIKKLIPLVFLAVSLAGCGIPQKEQPKAVSDKQDFIRSTDFKLNTVVTVTIYDSRDQTLLEDCMKLCDKYEAVFSRTMPGSELYQLNHRELPPVPGTSTAYSVSEELAELISLGLDYRESSDGAFDIAIAPLTELWDFTAESPKVPEPEDIRNTLKKCGFEKVQIDGQKVTFTSPDTALDLGAVAKGYIADQIKEYLLSKGVESAIISLGGNVVCIGSRPDGTPFKIGIQKPFADRNETAAVMEIEDKSVVSSGIYERYFEEDGTLYHHILNPASGYPYDNDLISVTIISDKSVDGDALSTTCFALGYEKGMEYVQKLKDVQAVFITEDYELHYTENFRRTIPLLPREGQGT